MKPSEVVVLAVLVACGAPLAAQTMRVDGPRAPQWIGFASAVAIADGEVYVGRPSEAPAFPMPPSQAGGVHVFRLGGGGAWVEAQHVTAPDAVIGDGFGKALAVSGSLLVVGAPAHGGPGAAFVFRRDGGSWVFDTRLQPADGEDGDQFGAAAAVRGDVVLVGAPGQRGGQGAVYLYRRAEGRWTAAGTLRPAEGPLGGRFGAALAFDGERALIGAPGPSPLPGLMGPPPAPQAGAAYVYRQVRGVWGEEAKLTVSGDTMVAALGSAVVLDGPEAFVSAPASDGARGAVYQFTRGTSGWVQSARIVTQQRPNFGLLGMALARAGNDLLVGSPFGGGNGAVWVFRRDRAGAWTQAERLGFPGVGTTPVFSWAIAASADLAIVGAPGGDFFEGAGYVYRRNRETGEWRNTATLVDALGGFPAVTGGAVECRDGSARMFSCRDVDLLAFLPVSALGGKRGIMLNDIWGWTDPQTGREYALVGRVDATAFVDVTDPANPVYLGELPKPDSAQANVWRDIKVYRDHAFIVSDGAGPHGMQVFDLTRLRNVRNPPVTFTADARYTRIHSAHNIVINEETGFAYAVGNSMGGETCGGGLHMVDIREPKQPRFAGCYADTATGMAKTGYTHDAQCVLYKGPDRDYQGREICFNSSETALGIADVTDKANPKAIASASYPNVAYAHQGWLSEDQRYFFLDDEGDELAGTVPRTRTIVWDVEDLDDPVVLAEFLGTTAATDHNLYIRGNYMYQSNYVAGLRIVDISDPANPREVGYFDTVPGGDNVPGFAGSWSNYPFFRSGTIAVTSMREGLFLLKFRPQRPVP